MLVTTEELQTRLPFTMDEDETREAEGALTDLSFDAQTYGSAKWIDATSTPASVKNLIARAAARHMKNYEGYTASRAGDEQVAWAEQENPGQATFNEDEKRMLRQMGGNQPFIGGVSTYAWSKAPARTVGMVPTSVGNDFPLFASDTEPW